MVQLRLNILTDVGHQALLLVLVFLTNMDRAIQGAIDSQALGRLYLGDGLKLERGRTALGRLFHIGTLAVSESLCDLLPA